MKRPHILLVILLLPIGIIAAFISGVLARMDYKRYCRETGSTIPRKLFYKYHRTMIMEQLRGD